MKVSKVSALSLFVAAILCVGVLLAEQHPATNINAQRHPNLAQAQQLIKQAFDKITAAQSANEWDMAGHARKAKELLGQASDELKLAAEESNKHKNQ